MTTTVGLAGQQQARSARRRDARQSTRSWAWDCHELPGGAPTRVAELRENNGDINSASHRPPTRGRGITPRSEGPTTPVGLAARTAGRST